MMKNTHNIMLTIVLVGCLICYCSTKQERLDDSSFKAATTLLPTSQTGDERQTYNEDITQSRENAITRAVTSISPAVVGINVTQIRRYVQRYPFDDPFWSLFFRPQEYQEKVQGLGSGFLISPEGYILTNVHVVEQASEIIVTTTDGKQYGAEVVGEDATYDVALLKIQGENFSFIPLGDSDDIIIGEWVIALGNPFGLFDVSSKPTVTVGVISATGMNFKGQLRIEGRSYEDMIQTDASINRGNSGGPLVNSLGQCIGINTFIISGGSYSEGSVGIGFAIPINRVKKILPDLKKIGRVDRSFQTGLEVDNINQLVARMLGISSRDGVIVSRVSKNSPAERAGVEVGDIIFIINGERIHSTTDVQKIINAIDVTETKSLQLRIFRNGKIHEVELELER
ncbi:MAG: trypsin-like peptidase domain-containing protein [bacterium]